MPKYDNFDLDIQNTEIVATVNSGRYERTCSERVAGTEVFMCCDSFYEVCRC